MLATSCKNILIQLSGAVADIHQSDFTLPSPILSNASIGQHVRHTLEFFICLEEGLAKGTVNYDKRAHDKSIENDKDIALAAIARIINFIDSITDDRKLLLEVSYNDKGDDTVMMETNYWRELAYNIEHAVHHMAIIKIGIRQIAPYVRYADDFGIAASTIRFHGKQAVAAR